MAGNSAHQLVRLHLFRGIAPTPAANGQIGVIHHVAIEVQPLL